MLRENKIDNHKFWETYCEHLNFSGLVAILMTISHMKSKLSSAVVAVS